MNGITKALLIGALLGCLWLLFPSLVLAGCTGSSPTWTSTPDQASVASCVSQANDGDTITIAAGSATWTSGVTVSAKGLTIKGTGTPNSTPSQMGASSSCTQTIITLNGTFDGFTFLPGVSSSLTHISCIQFSAASSNHCAAFSAGGSCNSSTCSQLRADNLTFDASMNASSNACAESGQMMLVDNIFGVADHDTAVGSSNSSNLPEFLGIHHSAWQGIGQYGDNSWHMPDTFGTAQTFYAENNTIGPNVLGSENESSAPTGRGGGRLAVRFSSCVNCEYGALLSWHGTDSSQRFRGGRQGELYGSTFNCSTANCQAGDYSRSGVHIEFGNTWTAGSTGSYMGIGEFRLAGVTSPPWNACPGPFDQASPLICIDQPCRARGALLSGDTPTPSGWASIQEVIDPCYEWNDTGGNAFNGRISPNPSGWATQNQDYYLASFGPIASIPTSCRPGVTVPSDATRPDLPGQGYGTTDTGNWNQSGRTFGSTNQTQGQLYVCKSSNVNPVDINGNASTCRAKNTGDNNYWCLYYTPYTYPHPLITGTVTDPPPNPPTGLQVVVE
jgi:hypothetical protein